MYDALAESVRLIETGVTAGAEPLTRRHRFLPVAFDVDGDLAVTVFLHRSHGGASWDQHVLTRGRGGTWALHGGGGSGVDDLDVLTHLPTVESLGGHAGSDGGGMIMVRGGGWFGAGRMAQHASVLVAPSVAAVTTRHGRALHRPPHGRLAVVWWGRQALRLTLRDVGGDPLPSLVVGGDGRMPLRY